MVSMRSSNLCSAVWALDADLMSMKAIVAQMLMTRPFPSLQLLLMPLLLLLVLLPTDADELGICL